MQAPCDATLLRIFLREDDVFDGKPLCDQLVRAARALGLAGATATRGFLGYGPAAQEPDLRLSDDVPVIVEIIDTDENIRRFLPAVDPLLENGVITLQRVSVVRSGRTRSSSPA